MAALVGSICADIKRDHKLMLERARKADSVLYFYYKGRRGAQLEILGKLLYPDGRGWAARYEGPMEEFRVRLDYVAAAKSRRFVSVNGTWGKPRGGVS